MSPEELLLVLVVADIAQLLPGIHCCAVFIDYICDLSLSVQEDTEQVLEMDVRACWSYDATRDGDVVVAEEGVNSHSVALMVSYYGIHEVTDLTQEITLGHVIREFRLEEVSSAVITAPVDKRFESVLGKQSVSSDVISIDGQCISSGVPAVRHGATDIMVSPPEPSVVDNHVARVDPHDLVALDLCLC